jgi:methylated-DNA-[protein]-cysteine S-methyltransferase
MNQGWKTFPTALGVCGVAWSLHGVTHFCLPEADGAAIARRLRECTDIRSEAKVLPAFVKRLLVSVKAHMKGDAQDFSDVPLVFAGASDFVQAVYRTACRIPPGSVLTYAELAAALGRPGAARAVGGALGRNPIPLLVPCHRIVAAGGKPGGFSAPGGLASKMALLECEGVALEKPALIATPAQWRKAVAHLQRDKKMAALIARVGPIDFQPHNRAEPLTSLIAAIVSQQLSVKAAATIQKRVDAIIHVDGAAHPEKLLRTSDDELRAAGLSYMKVSFLKDLARKYLDGELPTAEQLQNLSNEQIIKRFTHVKGIGRWTVEMYLIFNLGRADVWPVDDLGVRKGLAQLFKLPETPSAEVAKNYGDKWSPYRSAASLYLWRSLDNG